ncbi:circadian locomoter output cycles protein kaput [Eurosta solidaginis]|uniref:circadian locomoter output cycles protein kaput n=1 Tax=Eurosta solidaginis TaxID=178769 RepID=UPI003530B771
MSIMPTNMAEVDTEINLEGVVGVAHTGREARNLAEKHRRDKLNASIQELASMVPHVADSQKRPDKTGILRFAAHGLRLHYVFGKSVPRQKKGNHIPALSDDPHLTDVLTHMLDSFFITLTCHGQIVVISTSVEQLLGHCQSDLYGQNLLSITHPDDQAHLLQQLIPRDMEYLFRSNNEYNMHHAGSSGNEDDDALESDGSGEDYYHHHTTTTNATTQPSNSLQHTDDYLSDIDRRLRNDRRAFTVRLARAGTRSEATRKYELVKFDGCFRRSDYSCLAGTFPIVSQLIRRTRNNGTVGLHMMQHDVIAQAAMHGISGNDVVLVAMGRIIRSSNAISRLVIGNGQMEYRTRHLIDGRIVDTDQRIGLVAGYMKDEVCNLSPFSFMHQDDVRWVIVALRRMYDSNNEQGESVYRLLTRNGHFIYLQSKGFMDVSDRSNNVYSFICINTLLDEEEGKRRLLRMKNKFSTIIKTKIPSNSLQDVPASENPQQLERIVFYLIDNLQTRHDNSNGTGCVEATTTQADNLRYAKTPPLSLVPPEPASVKNSISQSVTVVNVTAARNLQKNRNQMKSPRSTTNSSDMSLSPANSIDLGDDFVEHMSAVSPSSIHSNTTAAATPKTITTVANAQRMSVLQLNTQATTTNKTTTTAQTPQPAQTAETMSPRVYEQRHTNIANTQIATITNIINSSDAETVKQPISMLKRLHPMTVNNNNNNKIIVANNTNCINVNNSNRDKSADNFIDESVSPAKRCTTTQQTSPMRSPAQPNQIHSVISYSLDHIDQSLQSIQENARTLCQQHARILPKSVPQGFNHKLDAIIVEHQRQAEQLINIKNEYDVHLQHQHQQQPHSHYQQLQQTQIQQQQQLQLLSQEQQQQVQFVHTNGARQQLTCSYVEPITKLNQLTKML